MLNESINCRNNLVPFVSTSDTSAYESHLEDDLYSWFQQNWRNFLKIFINLYSDLETWNFYLYDKKCLYIVRSFSYCTLTVMGHISVYFFSALLKPVTDLCWVELKENQNSVLSSVNFPEPSMREKTEVSFAPKILNIPATNFEYILSLEHELKRPKDNIRFFRYQSLRKKSLTLHKIIKWMLRIIC